MEDVISDFTLCNTSSDGDDDDGDNNHVIDGVNSKECGQLESSQEVAKVPCGVAMEMVDKTLEEAPKGDYGTPTTLISTPLKMQKNTKQLHRESRSKNLGHLDRANIGTTANVRSENDWSVFKTQPKYVFPQQREDTNTSIDQQLLFASSKVKPDPNDPLFEINEIKGQDDHVIFERVTLDSEEYEAFLQCILYYDGLWDGLNVEHNLSLGNMLRKELVDRLLYACYGIAQAEAEEILYWLSPSYDMMGREMKDKRYYDLEIYTKLREKFMDHSGRTKWSGPGIYGGTPNDSVAGCAQNKPHSSFYGSAAHKEGIKTSLSWKTFGEGGARDEDNPWGFVKHISKSANSSCSDTSNIFSTKVYNLWLLQLDKLLVGAQQQQQQSHPAYASKSHIICGLRYIFNLYLPTEKIDEDLLLSLYSQCRGVPIVVYGISSTNGMLSKQTTYIPTLYNHHVGSYLYVVYHHHSFDLLEPKLKRKRFELFTLQDLQPHPPWPR